MWTRGVQGLHSPGVQKAVQKCGSVRGSRWARNPVVAPFQFLPRYYMKEPRVNPWVLSCSSGESRQDLGGGSPRGDPTAPVPATKLNIQLN